MENMHFYSKVTRVSLELPVGWEEFNEAKNSVTYLYELDEDQEDKSGDPKISIALFPVSKPEENVLEIASASLLNAQKNILEKLVHRKTEVDAFHAVETIFTYEDASLGGKIYHHNVFVLVDDVLYSVSMLCALADKEEYSKVFKEAITSARFIF